MQGCGVEWLEGEKLKALGSVDAETSPQRGQARVPAFLVRSFV
jgi:hypothetical protein